MNSLHAKLKLLACFPSSAALCNCTATPACRVAGLRSHPPHSHCTTSVLHTSCKAPAQAAALKRETDFSQFP